MVVQDGEVILMKKIAKVLTILKQGVENLGNYISRSNNYEEEKAREGLIRGDAIIGIVSSNLPKAYKSMPEDIKKIQEKNWNTHLRRN